MKTCETEIEEEEFILSDQFFEVIDEILDPLGICHICNKKCDSMFSTCKSCGNALLAEYRSTDEKKSS